MTRLLTLIAREIGLAPTPESSPLCFWDGIHQEWIYLPLGQHVAIGAVTGGGKSNLLSNLIINCQPEVDTGHLLIYGIDLKGGVELGRYGGYLTELATNLDEVLPLLENLNQIMDERFHWLRAHYRTSIPMTRNHPAILLVIDEISALAGAADKQAKQKALTQIDRLLFQGRAADITVIMAGQDVRKDAMPLRDHCPTRIALRLNSADEARMLLGDSAIEAGAAPWLIGARQPGRGYIYNAEQNKVVQFQTGYIDDGLVQRIRDTHPTRRRIDIPYEHSDTVTKA